MRWSVDVKEEGPVDVSQDLRMEDIGVAIVCLEEGNDCIALSAFFQSQKSVSPTDT